MRRNGESEDGTPAAIDGLHSNVVASEPHPMKETFLHTQAQLGFESTPVENKQGQSMLCKIS